MQSELVSVVLPIYNVEKYLEKCIETVVNQTYKNIEIILVDDGSPDNCPEICDRWAEKDNRIKVVHKQNAGLGMARNTGIENATGKYICFFDSDDFVAEDTVEKAYNCIKKNSAEIVCFGFSSVDSEGKLLRTFVPRTEKEVFSGNEVQEEFLPNLIYSPSGIGWNLNMSSCMAMFSMELIKKANWRFVSEREILSEDVYSLIDLYKDVNKVAVLNEAFYFYRENNASLSRVYRKDRYERVKHCYEECTKLCKRLKYNDDVIDRVSLSFLSNTIAAMKQVCAGDLRFGEKMKELKLIVDNSVLQKALKDTDLTADSKNRRILFFSMQKKFYILCYILCNLKN